MNPKLRQAMEEFERESLKTIPTVFGRIVYLSSLRNAGGYRERSLEDRLGVADARSVLSKLHCDLVAAWLRFAMQERHHDLGQYLAGQEDRAGARKRLHSANIAELLPKALGPTDRDLFLSEFRILLAIMRRQEPT